MKQETGCRANAMSHSLRHARPNSAYTQSSTRSFSNENARRSVHAVSTRTLGSALRFTSMSTDTAKPDAARTDARIVRRVHREDARARVVVVMSAADPCGRDGRRAV